MTISRKQWFRILLAASLLTIVCECACVAQEQTPAAQSDANSKVQSDKDATNKDADTKNQDGSATTNVPVAKETGGFLGLGKKEIYTGPTEIVVLPPAPMLDNEGKQRLDPDGKPMFNPPVKQQRDKYGHPLFDERGKPVFQTATELGYDEHGHKIHAEKVKPPKMTPVSIAQGTYTVD